jgi:predicted Rossmann-fold nucleotide-binding protein
MEAVSRGAAEAGAHVIGVTCDEIERWRPIKPNAWVHEERRFVHLNERLEELVRACDGAIALPGGPGTLTEIALSWNLMIVAAMLPKALILVGPGWKSVFQTMFNDMDEATPSSQRQLLQFAPDVESAVSML